MTRIIGGSAKGRRLRTPPGETTRPTSDRVREAVFSAMQSWAGQWSGLRLLDLYAGSGAIGLEAWSRGVQRVVCVESDRRAAATLRGNADDLGAEIDLRTMRVAAFLGPGPTAPESFDIAYLDPPYPLGETELAADLEALCTRGWLAEESLLLVERSSRSPEPSWPTGVSDVRPRRYGETTVWSAGWYGRPDQTPSGQE